MKKLIVAVAILLIGIVGYVFVARNIDKNNVKSKIPAPLVAGESRDVGLVGKWEVAGNDFEYTVLLLNSDGLFTLNGYFIQNPNKPYSFTGSWKSFQKDGEKYLNLILETPVKLPSTKEGIDTYKSWGQEFVGANEIHLKLTTNSSGVTFRYDGNLMLKTN